MSNRDITGSAACATTLPAWRLRALLFQALLICAAVVLPAVAHLSGAPVRILLPMHWPVLLAGLVYGWRGGGAVGLLAPGVSFAITGFPVAAVLPAMTVELAVYGLLTGLLVDRTRLGRFVSVALALAAGRLAFIAVAILTGYLATGFTDYLWAALVPGLPVAVAQVVALPPLARSWVTREERRDR
jgi:hypothetical protein